MLNGNQVREHVLARARKQVREMALEGMAEDDIKASFDGQLSETERHVVWALVRSETGRGLYSPRYRPESAT